MYLYLPSFSSQEEQDIEPFNSISSPKIYSLPPDVNSRGLRSIVVLMLWSGPRAASPYVLPHYYVVDG